MDKIYDGGPAFPTTAPLEHWGDPNRGMLLRDWFAGQALAGLLAGRWSSDDSVRDAAEVAYMAADAMLATREDN
jgi:hypothetical protein